MSNPLDALGDRFALWFMRSTIRWMSDSAVDRGRANISRELAKYDGLDGSGIRFGRKFLALFDAELGRRSKQADFWGAP